MMSAAANVLEASRSAIEPTIDRLATYVDISGGFDGFLRHIVDLRDAAQVTTIAEAAPVDPSASGNPIPFTVALAAEVFTRACEGQLERTP